ncbi:LysE family translocator [Rhodovulum adriaticum]|uniref:Threonine/homoserine/homoserine lactone efflux protein n=1 Tax=Rhodovulum adriaticum TaxID=35804 RepID=A0A4V2SKX9_RHOAD|nr:LysE family translocator [Rhodovulum adriaticum]MBK1636558.1 MFS transporter [Rhodovulum adriaticum]TCP21206.1 threonine/homoserine/homoserine lactone efflux protein [Rhodovulum adriaticum]
MTYADILSFALVATLLTLTPGPNGVLIARTVPGSGRLAGFANIAGFVTAFGLHGALSVLGISVLLVQSAQAFMVVKLLGAGYLIWIGVKALRAAFAADPQAGTPPPPRRRSLRAAYAEGVLTNALNPKVSMFYLAAFPQFIAPGETPVAGAFLLVALHAGIVAAWFGTLTMMFARLARATRSGAFRRWVNGITGLAFVGFGAKLATYRPNL